jgi:hypothetical protein
VLPIECLTTFKENVGGNYTYHSFRSIILMILGSDTVTNILKLYFIFGSKAMSVCVNSYFVLNNVFAYLIFTKLKLSKVFFSLNFQIHCGTVIKASVSMNKTCYISFGFVRNEVFSL